MLIIYYCYLAIGIRFEVVFLAPLAFLNKKDNDAKSVLNTIVDIYPDIL